MTEHAPALARAATDTRAFALANCIRALAIDGVEAANSGHPGAPMGMAEAATVLWTRHMKFDAARPDWPDRDRFVLSNGHGSMLLYALLHLTGFEDMPVEELKNFRQWGAKTAGHPEYGHVAGVDVTTGPLGQGLAGAVGMCMAEAHLAARFGREVVDHRTWVFCGDGCLMEGISQEAISLAGHLKLSKLCVLYDDNGISIDGTTDKSFTEDTTGRFEAAGWQVIACDGHDVTALDEAITRAKAETTRPTLIRMRTVIGLARPTRPELPPRMVRRWAPRSVHWCARRSTGPTRISPFPQSCSPNGAPPERAVQRTVRHGRCGFPPSRRTSEPSSPAGSQAKCLMASTPP